MPMLQAELAEHAIYDYETQSMKGQQLDQHVTPTQPTVHSGS